MRSPPSILEGSPRSSIGARHLVVLAAALFAACGGDGDSRGAGDSSGGGATPGPDTQQPAVDTTPGPGVIDVAPTVPDVDQTVLGVIQVDPGVGATKGGDVVTVIGSGFVDGEVAVYFGPSLASDVFVVSRTHLICTTPPAEPGLVDVRVSRPSTDESATLPLGFRYQSPVLITAVEPNEGHVSGGLPVTLSGSGFLRGVDGVLFGGRAAIGLVVVDDRTLQLTTPPGDLAGAVDIRITAVDGSGELSDGFTYFDSPRLDTVTPGIGPTAGGTEVQLLGAGFTEDSVVRFGDATATKTTFAHTGLIMAVTPPGAGLVSVTVETARGTAGLAKGFVYADPVNGVVLHLAQPDKGSVLGGTPVSLVVTGLTATTGVVARFNGVPAQVVAVEPAKSRVQVIAPPGSPGAVDLAIESSDGNAVLPGGFTYVAAFDVVAVSPPGGPMAGGTSVEIVGHGFKDGANVRIGALPCAAVEVKSPTLIACVTPAGSPGSADVRVKQGSAEAILEDGYTFIPPTIGVYAVTPNKGAQAGGTYVSVLGAGFEAPIEVRFGGKLATHVTVESPTHITCRTPPGEVGTVDVDVSSDGVQSTLSQAYTYFDPLSLFGGTWGPGVEGSVNVTVMDTGGTPLPDAYVILAVDADTPYQGYTNSDGQITFSGPDVLGTQMVSASKPGYESASVIRFDATNITLALQPIPPPSSGPPPPGATVSGRVFGLGKYVVIPEGDCDFKQQPDGQCQPCIADADCPSAAGTCTPLGGETFCTASCLSDLNCPTGFGCLAVSGVSEGQCLPVPGKKQARCYTSLYSMFSPLPEADAELAGIVNDDGTYEIGAPLGETAVICLGGFVNETNPDPLSNFTPVAVGVARHLIIAPGPNPNKDVTLNHPLTRTLKIRLDDPPHNPDIGLEYTAALVYWNFGSDGGFMHRSFQDIGYLGFSDPVLTVDAQPEGFTGDLYDARFEILGITLALGDDNTQLPASFTYLRNIVEIETGSAYELTAGQWTSTPGAVGRTVNDIAGTDISDLWAVGDRGAILHGKNGAWAVQPSPTTQPLYGAFAASATDIWAVGDGGTVLRFGGTLWETVDVGAGTYDELRGVFGFAPSDVWIVAGGWSGFWHWDGVSFTRTYSGSADLRDVHGRDGLLVAVGSYGALRHLENGVWVPKFGPNTTADLEAVHVVSATEAYAVGQGGVAWRWDGVAWTAMVTPTTRALREVYALGSQNVYAVGDAATRLHFDGNAWTDQTVTGETSYTALLSLWGDPDTGEAVALGANEVLMGPMLRVPENQNPEDGAKIVGDHISFTVDPSGVPAHFNYITVTIPTLMGETPVWTITTDGDVYDFTLPDFENIEGTPGIATGNTYILRIFRVFKEEFTIDNYDFSDLDTTRWRSWAIDATTFSK